MSKKINLPSVLTKDVWFYEDNKEVIDPHLGKFYISYSTVNSFTDPKYFDGFIKSKLVGIRDEGSCYTSFGSWCGSMLEEGVIPSENPEGFTGAENFDFSHRLEGAEYEKFILIDRGEYVIIGFIDRYMEYEEGIEVTDQKTGGKGKEDEYKKNDYIQTVLYAHAMELKGKKVRNTNVLFMRREKSHLSPPLHLSKEQFFIELPYNQERVEYALNKVDKVVEGITKLKNTYDKVFKK